MIDTVELFYEFPNRYDYQACYNSIDSFSREYDGQALHKDDQNQKNIYITTSFARMGILRISFQKTKYHRYCYVMLQPARLLQRGARIRLSQEKDFSEVAKRMNKFIKIINDKCDDTILPTLRLWRVKRIDYAVNVITPHVVAYINLFYKGGVPKGFTFHERYETSLYLVSPNGNINFYDKMKQLRDKHCFTDMEVNDELGYIPQGVLRLEFQCSNKYVQHLKEYYHLADTTLPYLWNAEIAENELCSRVESIIGKTDFFSYALCAEKLEQFYKCRTLSFCLQVIRILRDNSNANLREMEKLLSASAKKQCRSLIHKIRKAGVNPIPLEAAGNCAVKELTNPYNLIRLS